MNDRKNQSKLSTSFISSLRNIAQQKLNEENEEKCHFCGKVIPHDHRHLIDITTRKFMCSCEICAILQAENGQLKPIPDRKIYLQDFKMPADVWNSFLIPVNMAFFVFSSEYDAIVSYYPAPTGATESKLKMEPWKKLAELNPVLEGMNRDVEALLINRLEDGGDYFLVPIDICYELIGTIRSSWEGLFGGREVDKSIRNFFRQLKKESKYA